MHFVAAALGPGFVQPPVMEHADVLRQSNERTPILFVLSPGADPAFDIFKLGAYFRLYPSTCERYLPGLLLITWQTPRYQQRGLALLIPHTPS